MAGDPLRLQKAIESEAVTTRFIATDHWGRFGETNASFGLSHCSEQAFEVTCGHDTFAWVLTMVPGETELPRVCTQCKGHKRSLWSAIIESPRRKRVSLADCLQGVQGIAPLDNDAPSSDNSQE